MRETCPEAQFFLIGGGPERAGLQERARTELLTNVTFLPAVSKSEMADVYSAADVGLHVLADVNLFRYGVSPNKVSDYMAAGLPVVTNSPGEVTELVEQAGAGVGVEPGAIAAGVTLMHRMGDAGRAECGRAGRAYVERYRSRTVLARELQKLLDSTSKN